MSRLSCTRAQRRLLKARDGGVGLAERLALDEHLAGCAVCRRFDRRDAALDQALAGLPEPPSPQLDIEAHLRAINASIDSAQLRRTALRRRTRRVAAVAAGVLAFVSAVVVLARRSPEALSELVGQLPLEVPPASVVERDGDGVGDAPEEIPLDLERLARARADARAALRASALPQLSLPEQLARLDLELAALRAAGWPVERLVERHLGDADGRLVALAARWLGRAGERLAVTPIAALLRREDASPELRSAALEALIELGAPARSALLASLDDADLRARALQGLMGLGGDELARDLARDLARVLRNDPATARDIARDGALCSALLELGEPGIDALVLLAAEGRPASLRALALGTLERSEDARLQLTARLGERAGRSEREARLRVAARLGLEQVLPLVLDAALEREQRAAALAAVGDFRGSGAWAVLVDLWVSGRVPESDLLEVARGRLAADALEIEDVIELAELRGDRAGLGAQLDMLLALEVPAAAPGLVLLAGCRALAPDQRQWAVLALLDVGAREQVADLARVLRELAPADQRLAAACTLVLHALGGPAAVAEALGPDGLERSNDLAALFAARPADRNRAVTLSRASRLVQPWLELNHSERPRTDL